MCKTTLFSWISGLVFGLTAFAVLAPGAAAQNFDDLFEALSEEKPFALRVELASDFYFRGLDQIERDAKEPGYSVSGMAGLPVSELLEDAPESLRLFAGFEAHRVDILNVVPPGFTNAGARRNGASHFIPLFGGVTGRLPFAERIRWTFLGGYLWFPDSRVPQVTGGRPILAPVGPMGALVPVGFQPTLGHGNTGFSFWEIGTRWTYEGDLADISVMFLTGPNVLGLGGRSYYTALDVTVPLPDPLNIPGLGFQLELHGANQAITRNAGIGVPNFREWSVGLRIMWETPDYGRFYVRIRYTDTDVPANRCQFNPFTGTGSGICEATAIVTLGWIW